jgi:hypothetical protein
MAADIDGENFFREDLAAGIGPKDAHRQLDVLAWFSAFTHKSKQILPGSGESLNLVLALTGLFLLCMAPAKRCKSLHDISI